MTLPLGSLLSRTVLLFDVTQLSASVQRDTACARARELPNRHGALLRLQAEGACPASPNLRFGCPDGLPLTSSEQSP